MLKWLLFFGEEKRGESESDGLRNYVSIEEKMYIYKIRMYISSLYMNSSCEENQRYVYIYIYIEVAESETQDSVWI